MNKVDWRVIAVGLFCITAVEIYAISQGINGYMLSVFFAIAGTAIGITIPNFLKGGK